MARRAPALILTILAVVAVLLLVITGGHDGRPGGTRDDSASSDGTEPRGDDAPLLQGGGRPQTAEVPPPPTREAPPVAARHAVGRLVNAAGEPVGRAMVWWGTRMPGAQAVRSGPRGTFAVPIDDLAGETLDLRARGPGTATAREDIAITGGSEDIDVGDVVLPAGLEIRGRVVDRAGNPRPYVRVRTWSEVPEETGEIFSGGTRILFGGDDVATTAAGTFVLKGLAAEPHRVYVDLTLAEGWMAEPPSFTGVVPGGDPLTFVFYGRTRVAGLVVDAESGEPVTRFQVRGRLFDHPEGRFAMGLAAGQPLEVRARGYLDYRRHDLALREGEEADHLTVRLEPNPNVGTLVVRAVNAAGDPLTGWRVSGFGPDWFGWSERCEEVSGEVRVVGLIPGRHHFNVRGVGLSHALGMAEVARHAVVEKTVVLERGGTVRLRALAPDGTPLKYARLEVLDEAGKLRFWHFVFARPQGTSIITTETSGTAGKLGESDGRLSGLPAGRYTVRVTHDRTVLAQVIDLPREGEIELVLRQDG